jgi:ADP-ribose pyrophosphatase YjhB (NUDIX family)
MQISSSPQKEAAVKEPKSVTFGKSSPPDVAGGAPFKSWAAPRTHAGWQELADAAPRVSEPPLPPLTVGLTRGAGVIIREPDGRVWLVKPTGGFGGYDHTFPKGRADKDLTLQATAMKEAFEETGLQVEITGFAGDVLRSTSLARYYFARRVGGTPVDAGWEAEGVTLAPPDELNKYLNTSVDRLMVRQFLKAEPT